MLDTNVVLNALFRRLPYQHILRNLMDGRYQLCLSSEILLEYEEKIVEIFSQNTADTLLDAFSISTNVFQVEPHFRFNFIKDLDDNKFVDCAFSANCHFIVSDDRGFKVLKNMDFPKIEVLTLAEFSQVLAQLLR